MTQLCSGRLRATGLGQGFGVPSSPHSALPPRSPALLLLSWGHGGGLAGRQHCPGAV